MFYRGLIHRRKCSCRHNYFAWSYSSSYGNSCHRRPQKSQGCSYNSMHSSRENREALHPCRHPITLSNSLADQASNCVIWRGCFTQQKSSIYAQTAFLESDSVIYGPISSQYEPQNTSKNVYVSLRIRIWGKNPCLTDSTHDIV